LTPTDLPSISLSDATVTEGSTANAVFTVALSNAYSKPVTVNYATADAGAVAGSDYQAVSGTLTFAPGETTKTIVSRSSMIGSPSIRRGSWSASAIRPMPF